MCLHPVMQVTTTTLEMRSPDQLRPSRRLVGGLRIERVAAITPEYLRWLYAAVGGPWRWTDRLGWSRAQWADELAEPGAEVWVAYDAGAPAGYAQLRAAAEGEGTAVEIRYFGLIESAIGRGLGGRLLTEVIAQAWTLPGRYDLPDATRVWLHTGTLDGPQALANYRARGFEVIGSVDTDEDYPEHAPGAWTATTGLTG